ncbi:hypothetical protein ABZ208_30600 [Streptomyces sp. NPDC006208]|uniref:hypothetical protein n=1 Tax=Streptomyces sp. NPDC006208 TaxID=3156734 RepID=UPI0033BF005C
MLALALLLVLFTLALTCTLRVTRIRDIPTWRRYLPVALLLAAATASLLRAFDVPEVANTIAFPLNLAAIALSQREVAAQRTRESRRAIGDRATCTAGL